MKPHSNVASEAAETMEAAAHDLVSVARKLEYAIPGSPALADLRWIASALEAGAKELRKSSDADLFKQFDDAKERSGLMLKAVLAGFTIADKPSPLDTGS